MVLLLVLSLYAWADESLPLNMDEPMPIIQVDDGKVKSVDSSAPAAATSAFAPTTTEATVDLEVASPIAPQVFDKFGGVVQEPFGPTDIEREEMRQRVAEEERQLQLRKMREEEKPRAPANVKPAPATVKHAPAVVKSAPVAAKKPASITVKPAPVAAKPTIKKPGALSVAPKTQKK